MKRKYMKSLIFAAIVAGTLFSCQKLPSINEPETPTEDQQDETPGLPSIDETSPSLINAEIPSAIATKVAVQGKGGAVYLSWEAGDSIRIISDNGGNEVFRIVEEGMTPYKAGFTGNPLEGNGFTVLYPGEYADSTEWLSRSYAGQIQKGNGTSDHLKWSASLSGLSRYGSIVFEEREGIDFRQSGVIHFNLKVPERFEDVSKVTLSVGQPLFPLTNSAEGEKTDTLSLALENVVLSEEEHLLSAYMMTSCVPVLLEEGTAYTITIHNADGQNEKIEKTAPEGGLLIGGVVTTMTVDAKDIHEPLFWGGEGTEASPYEIKTYRHLTNVSDKSVQGMKFHFKLIGDIELTPAQAASYKETNEFKGVFYGNGHKISGLTTPLFGNIRGGLVSDLEVEANITHNGKSTAQIIGTDYGIGILAHYLYRVDTAYNHVKNVTVRGSVTIDGLELNHNYMIGGMVGSSNNVSVSGCRNYAKVIVKSANVEKEAVRAGGLIGALQSSSTATFTNCENYGPVIVESVTTTGDFSVGGLFGYSTQPFKITDCRNYGYVDVDSVNVTGEVSAGGVLGFTTKAVKFTNCDNMEYGYVSVNYNDKNVKWTSVGGIIGSATGKVTLTDCDNAANLLNCNTAFDTGANYSTGGIAGKLIDSPITNCTSSGEIKGAGNVGGIIGYSTIASNNGITMTSCKSSGIIKSNCVGGDVHCIGGLAGCVVGKILKSSSTADIVSGDCKTNGVGGLVGGINGSWLVVDECCYDGDISAHSKVGGILGCAETENNVRIENSFSWGTINAKGGFAGGLVGQVLLPSNFALKSSNSYSRMSVRAEGAANGGLIGGGAAATGQYAVSGLLAWNTNLLLPENSDGVIVGQVHSGACTDKVSIANCWYGNDIRYESRVPGDDPDVKAGGKKRYDGKRAAAGTTCQQKAKELGWSTDFWKLDNADGYPTLLNVAK